MGPRQRRSLRGVRLEPGKLIALATVAQRADKRSEQLNVAVSGRVQQHEDAVVANIGGEWRLFGSLGHRFPDCELSSPAVADAAQYGDGVQVESGPQCVSDFGQRLRCRAEALASSWSRSGASSNQIPHTRATSSPSQDQASASSTTQGPGLTRIRRT
jgi:hypothetical protein